MKGNRTATVATAQKLRDLLVELAKEPETAKAAADALLEPLVGFFNAEDRAANYGRKTELALRMSRATGQSVTRDMVRAWLHPDQDKRRQPSFSYGLLLLVAAAGQMAESPS